LRGPQHYAAVWHVAQKSGDPEAARLITYRSAWFEPGVRSSMGLMPTKADLIFDHTVPLRRRVRGAVAIIPEAVCCPRTAAAGSELMCFLTEAEFQHTRCPR
jgi:hypothetical protein